MVLDADDLVRQWKEDSRGIDLDAIMQSYCDGYKDYEGEIFYSDDDDEMSMMSVETVMKDAKILADEKKKSDMLGTRMDAQSYSHHHWGYSANSSEVACEMDIEDGPSEPSMATVGKKKEKRKLQEDGVESEKNDGIARRFHVQRRCLNFLVSATVAEFKGRDIFGVAWVAQVSMELARIEANFSGLSPGKHGWTVTKSGDLTREAANTGEVFNPTKTTGQSSVQRG
ncbi:hypothetical protein C5167_043677 [Papaver somniferum]|uniref:Uncharacterized protein n=1 Tax=Papaver somniferum TaxID=3469 RepID=A0A4Y7L9X6_PAPSO|nr:hypothetical protein C5167_043677 [Papaver somniferum]